jgi:CAAX prenyl protease-like protein
MRRIVSRDFHEASPAEWSWTAAIVSSVLFGALHGGNWLAGTAAGLLYAVASIRRGRIGDAIVAHATTNGLLAIYALATGNWQAWS